MLTFYLFGQKDRESALQRLLSNFHPYSWLIKETKHTSISRPPEDKVFHDTGTILLLTTTADYDMLRMTSRGLGLMTGAAAFAVLVKTKVNSDFAYHLIVTVIILKTKIPF